MFPPNSRKETQIATQKLSTHHHWWTATLISNSELFPKPNDPIRFLPSQNSIHYLVSEQPSNWSRAVWPRHASSTAGAAAKCDSKSDAAGTLPTGSDLYFRRLHRQQRKDWTDPGAAVPAVAAACAAADRCLRPACGAGVANLESNRRDRTKDGKNVSLFICGDGWSSGNLIIK